MYDQAYCAKKTSPKASRTPSRRIAITCERPRASHRNHFANRSVAAFLRRDKKFFFSFDHAVGACEDTHRDREPDLPRRLEIDDQIELVGLFDRKIAGLRPLQDLVDKARRAPIQILQPRAVG